MPTMTERFLISIFDISCKKGNCYKMCQKTKNKNKKKKNKKRKLLRHVSQKTVKFGAFLYLH